MSASDFLTALGTGSGLPRAACAPAMTLRFTEVRCAAAHMGAALQGIFVGRHPCVLPGSAEKLGSGRCGERTERCRWQRKRSERVAAVKILSVRRKAAQKFRAPQQGHRPLRKRISGCLGEGLPIGFRRGRCPHRPASATRGAEERAGKSPKRCRWQKKRGGFEEVPRLAATTVAGNRLARRWAREPRPYGA